jgi:SAM-dependent methyltransferase
MIQFCISKIFKETPMNTSTQTIRQTVKHQIRDRVKGVFAAFGFDLSRPNPYEDYREYIPFHSTIAAAQQSGLSVCDYMDLTFNLPGATQHTIDQLKDLGVFAHPIQRVCEIGPGTGRYLEKVLHIAQPDYCEIYETAKNWQAWLVQEYGVVAQAADGTSLSPTPSNSIDLVQAHKVLPGQPSLVICRYLEEMARIVRSNGKVIFDIVTEDCMDDHTLIAWQESGYGYQHYPCVFPKQFTIHFFERRGFSFDGSFLVPMKPGFTECFVFTKNSLHG